MIFLSLLTVFVIVCGFHLNGVVPFAIPISMLIYEPCPWVYHLIILALIAVLIMYLCRIWKFYGPASVALACFECVLLLILLSVDCNDQPAHDILAFMLFFLSSIFLFNLSTHVKNMCLKACLSVPFFALPLVFSNQLFAIAMVELLLTAASLLLMNMCYYYPAGVRYEPGLAVPRGRSVLLDVSYYGSRMRGYLWACFCVFTSGVCGIYQNAPIAGVLHFGLCWVAGYYSKKFTDYPAVEVALYLGSGAVYAVMLSILSRVPIVDVVFPLFLMVMAVWSLKVYGRVMRKIAR